MKQHIANGVFAEIQGDSLRLSKEDGSAVDGEIFDAPEFVAALMEYLRNAELDGENEVAKN